MRAFDIPAFLAGLGVISPDAQRAIEDEIDPAAGNLHEPGRREAASLVARGGPAWFAGQLVEGDQGLGSCSLAAIVVAVLDDGVFVEERRRGCAPALITLEDTKFVL